jgi:hypothetical protein
LTNPNIDEYAFFAQDSWRTSKRLTLNYGVRYDYFRYAAGSVRNPDQVLADWGLDTSKIDTRRNTFAGRFGFALKLDESGNFLLRGGVGNFYARIPAILTGTAHSQNGIQVQTYTLSASDPNQAPLIPTYPNVLSGPPTLARTPDIYVVEPRFNQPGTYQWSLNLETKAGADYLITFGYLGVRGHHLSRTRDINLFPRDRVDSCVVPNVATPCSAANATPVFFYRNPTPRPNRNFGRISLFESGGDSIYHGGFVQVTKRYADNFQLQASYTFSKVIDTAPDATSVVVGTGDDAKVTQDTLNPNLDRGIGDANIGHRFVLSGVWDISYANRMNNAVGRYVLGGWQLSTIFQGNSGRALSALVNSDIGNDRNTRNDRGPGFGRNTLTGFGFRQWDMRLSKDINLSGDDRLLLRLFGEAFNVFNNVSYSSIQQGPYNYNAAANVFTPVANFRQATNAADPRILQLGARIIF